MFQANTLLTINRVEASSDPLKSKSYIIFSVSKVLLFKQYLAPLSQLNSYLTMTKSLGSHHSRRQCCCRRKIGFSSNCLQPHSQTGLYSVLVRLQSDPPFRSWFWLSRTPLHHCITWRPQQLTCLPFGHCATENTRAIRELESRQNDKDEIPCTL